MVLPMTPVEEKERRPTPAVTTGEAKTSKNPYLCLSTMKLTELPAGVAQLGSLTHLDLSNNAIACLPEASLPPSLVELTLTGCDLTQLPASIAGLPRLKKLFAGANRLQQVDCVFRSASLQHAGLAYNRVALLPPDEVLREGGLLSLDLAHNDLEGLGATLSSLASLPALAALSLGGNPLALQPRYLAEVRGRLKQLMFLDGQRLDLPVGSRPGTSTSYGGGSFSHSAGGPGFGGSSLQRSPPDGMQRGGGAGSVGDRAGQLGRSFGGSPHTTVHFFDPADEGGSRAVTAVEVEVAGVRPAEDPFAWIRERWAEQVADAEAAGGAAPPVLEAPEPPLQPLIYHIETTDLEGTPIASIPLVLSPPTPPDVATMFDPKAKAAAAAAAKEHPKRGGKPGSAAGKPGSKPGSPMKPGTAPSKPGSPMKPGSPLRAGLAAEAVEESPLERGVLRVTLPLCASAEHRNWLRAGAPVTLYRTTLTAVPRPAVAVSEPEPPKGPSKQATRKKKNDEPPPIEYDITSSTEVLGTAMLRAGAQVLDGYRAEGFECLEFRPPPALLDGRGIRLALKDPRHGTETVGRADVRVRLHVPLAGGGPDMWDDRD